MLTLYHSPESRSSRIIRLIDELDAFDEIDIQLAQIARQDGRIIGEGPSPHPDGKVPYLVHDGVGICESNAIMLYLTELFPQAGMAPAPGDPQRGAYLSWLAWYGNVVEPVMVMGATGLSHPILDFTFRGKPEIAARLANTLKDAPYLLGERFSAADLLLVSPFTWFPETAEGQPAVKDWIARCEARPSAERTLRYDKAIIASAEKRCA